MTAYTIVGAGAIGGLVGAALHGAGHDVTFVEADPAHREAIAARGLRIEGHRAMHCTAPAIAPAALGGGLARVILAVKSLHTRDAIPALAGRLAPDGMILSLQNGLNPLILAETFGAGRVVGAYLTFGGYVEAPGVIRYAGEGSFAVGEIDGALTPRLTAMAAELSALQPCATTTNLMGHLWSKLVLGAVYYGTAVLDRDVIDIYADPQALAVLSEAAREAAAVAAANGAALEDCDGFEPAAFLAGDPAGIAASWKAQRAYWAGHVGSGRTGIWRDLAIRRRRTECEAHLGAMLDRRRGVVTPVLDRIRACVAAVEQGERALGWANLAAIAGG